MSGNPPRRSGFDDLVVPFIFVPDGDPEPTEWLARHPEYIKERATFVPRTNPNPSGLRQPGPDSGGPDFPHSAERPIQQAGAQSERKLDWPADPIGDYLRVEATLLRPEAVYTRGSFAQSAADTSEGSSSEDRATGVAAQSGYVAENPQQWAGRPPVGTGECVPLVQQATGAPRSTLWRPGELVQGDTSIRPGTAIATFDSNGHYVGHAAIYLGQNAEGIRVLDQWNIRDNQGHITLQHAPSERVLPFNDPRHSLINRGESYRVVR